MFLNLWIAFFTTVGTICVIVTLILVLRNRPKLKVTFDKISYPVKGFLIVAENTGGVPIYTKDAGIKLSSGTTLWAYCHVDNTTWQERVTVGTPILLRYKREYLINLEKVLIDSNDKHVEYKNKIESDKLVAFVYDNEGRRFLSNSFWTRLLRKYS